MSFATPKTDLAGLESNTPGRRATQSPTQTVPLLLGRGRVAVQWVTPVLHWHFRTFKIGQDAWFSAYGWLCLGPVDEIVQIIINDKPYNGIFKFREDYPDTDYVDHVMSFSGGEVTSRFRVWWGREDGASRTSYLQSLVGPDCPSMFGKTFPRDLGICALAVEDVYAGPTQNGETPPLPKIEMELYRRSPTAYSFGYAPHGTHPIGIVADLFTLPRGGRGLPLETTFNVTQLEAAMQRLMDVGVATMKGTDLFVSFVFAEAKELDEHIADVLAYFGGWIVERDGLLEIDWSTADGSIDEEELRVISEHELADEDVDEDPGDLDAIPSQVKVTGLDWTAPIPLSEATESSPVPFVQRITGEPRAPEPIDRPGFTTRPQLKAYATLYAAMRGNPDATFRLQVLRQYAVQLDDVTPLRAGDLFVLNLTKNGGKRVVVRITERTAEDATKVAFTCIRERGTFPMPAEVVLDPRLDPTIPPPADFARFTVAEIPPDIADDGVPQIAALVERPSNSTLMWQLDFSPVDSWPGVVLETGSPRWAVAAVLGTDLGATLGDATVTLDEVGTDWSYFRSQSSYEQEDARLLLYRAGEWMSVGTITPGGDGSYTLAGLKRAVLGSLPAAHEEGDIVFLIRRADLSYINHANFSMVESGGGYDEETATKWFKLRPLGAGGLQGNFTPAFSLTLTDPTPDAITGLQAITGTGKAVDLRWDPVVGALVNEYSVHRATGPSYADETQIGEAAAGSHPRYIDINVTIGTTYRYRVKAHATGEASSEFSGSVTATPGAVDTYSPSMSPPTAATAPVHVGGGTYLTDDGTRLAYATVTVKALPSGSAVGQYLWHGNADGADPYTSSKPYFNTSDEVVRIDDLGPGIEYAFGSQTFTINGVAAAITSGGTFVAAKATLGPSPPTSITTIAGDADGQPRPEATLFGNSGVVAHAMWVTFVQSADRDCVEYVVMSTSTDSDAAADLTFGFNGPTARTTGTKVAVYHLNNTDPRYVRVAGKNASGKYGAWGAASGDRSGDLKLPAGDLITMNANAVAITGGSLSGMVTVGTSSSLRWKTNVRALRNPLRMLWRLRGVMFDRTDHPMRNDLGLIAEEVDAIPELRAIVTRDKGGIPTGLDYGKLVGLCVAATKQLAIIGAITAGVVLLAIVLLAIYGVRI